ncbi:MAG: hypothetical protein A3C84_05140 [Candidatus Ryanbacteria bacterium RIFCSPHIGHO2_02_FULL_48_12]|uniref:Uncharacterized protein n=1 Tax=Candidatus Ryanbacteria bacterium RIFCSPHIGHO2_01_FULL_48_27 TaxID=1802115 RepID=A0A1G2G7A2_9BACT|nr:MAG: hypothetical protein A2756_05985 [Candidatus Ryanbacteria bacterium RIFCSPHIGHO2_01_FULL_48_27]OGZ49546.1 MAG: hypothetical protein A3C84_05140 [Candidatus Ryanbacteria bacterium RIFCSPHIGHO2_02_FULL_48_12]
MRIQKQGKRIGDWEWRWVAGFQALAMFTIGIVWYSAWLGHEVLGDLSLFLYFVFIAILSVYVWSLRSK